MATGPLRSERVVSRPWPSRAMGPVMLWAEKDESPLLMWVATGPVMALRAMSPWLAVTLTGALRELTVTSPWLAMTVAGAVGGTVMVRSARAPSRAGTVRVTVLPLVLRLGLRRWALVSASESERV